MTTRSRPAIAAAASTKASGPASKSSPSVSTRMPARQIGELLDAEALLQGYQTRAGRRGERREGGERHRARHVGFRIGVALPDDADLEARRADARGPFFRQFRFGAQDREPAAGTLSRRVPKARGKLLMAICASNVSPSGVFSTILTPPCEESSRCSFAGARSVGICPGARHHRQIADELDGVAEAVVVHHQHPLARSARPAPLGKAHAERFVERLSVDPARFVTFPAAFEIAERRGRGTPCR